MRRPSFTNKMQGNLSPMRRTPMLEQVNALPSPQGEFLLHDRNRKLHARQDRADMGGHIVGAFVGVPISAVVLRRQAVEIVSRSARTSRAAFSCISNPAEVCRQNRVKSPA